MSQIKSILKSFAGLMTLVFAFGATGALAIDATQNSITGVSASSVGNGTIVLKVDLAQPLSTSPNGFSVNTPPRIAFDFVDTNNSVGKTTQEINEGDLRSVNLIQAGNRTRLV
ncbi:MAG: type IV pilus secretin PilQ, partial [Gallionella sp.]